ncbi:MAG: cobalamin-dependent protein, partial [Desulfuromonadaceae bacterium]
AIALNPNYSEAHFNLGNALLELGNRTLDTSLLNQAEACYRSVLKIKPSADVHLNLGNVLRNLGRLNEALECFRLSLNPATDWNAELKNLTTPMVVLDGLVLNHEKTPYHQDTCNSTGKQAAVSTETPLSLDKEQELPLQSVGAKPLKIVLIYPPPWQILQPGEVASGTLFDAPKDWNATDLNEDTQIITYGLMTIAAQAKRAGHDVTIHNLSSTPWQEVVTLIAASTADVYGISTFTYTRRGMGAVAALIRQYHPKTHITVGGPFATALPRECLSFFHDIDTVVIGEGEETFMELLACLKNCRSTTGIAGTAWRNGEDIIVGPKRPRINDLDTLASPFDYFTSGIIMTSRGCPSKCTFCGSFTTWGQKLRFHSVEYCLDMFKNALSLLPAPILAVKDDTFTSDRRRAIAICDAIIDLKLNFIWSCDTRVDYLDDELLYKMRLAGCQMISLGVESGAPEILKSMHKNTTPEMVLEATRAARKYGLFVRYYMILLNRGETVKTLEQSTDLIKTGRPNQYSFCSLGFIPGTEDWEILSREQGVSTEIFFKNDFPELSVELNRRKKVHELERKILCDIGTINGFDYSIEEREAVVGILPDVHIVHLELANAYLRAGRLDKATVELDRAVELGFPIDIIIKNQRACVSLAKLEIENALTLLASGVQSSSCRIVTNNYNKLKNWADTPVHSRGKQPELDDSIYAANFGSFGSGEKENKQ